ncbi:hypothetical protein [Nonomuraea sp. NPDC003804]|uniref:hypothetical protein n=1 Tax=Nonomuraea sp. NPDC003804 TaxID=3154547 RepID=UPI0033A04D15
MTTVTHVGGPTALIELDGWRILTDPTFDSPGRRYGFGWGTSSVKQRGPAFDATDLADVDVVLLSTTTTPITSTASAAPCYPARRPWSRLGQARAAWPCPTPAAWRRARQHG